VESISPPDDSSDSSSLPRSINRGGAAQPPTSIGRGVLGREPVSEASGCPDKSRRHHHQEPQAEHRTGRDASSQPTAGAADSTIPESLRSASQQEGAFADPDPTVGLRKARRLAAELDRSHPDAAGSLHEGLDKMFTVRRLGIDGTLARTPACTNMIESMISTCHRTSRDVKQWRNEGDVRRRWCAAGMVEAERSFRRLRGHRQVPDLVAALIRHAQAVTPPSDTDRDPIAA
jgi:hypothetical protein